MRATCAISGTVPTRSSPEMAGTGAFFTGSIFIAIVPPVAMSRTVGRAGFGGSCASAVAPTSQKGTASRQAIDIRMGTSEQVSEPAVTLVGNAVQAAQRLQAAGRPTPRYRRAHRRSPARRQAPDAPGRDRVGQDVHGREPGRRGAAPDLGDRAQQDAGRAAVWRVQGAVSG